MTARTYSAAGPPPAPARERPPFVRPDAPSQTSENEIDATLDASFPASDPPSWTPLTGVRFPSRG
jgi:hypothetical protein